MLSELDLGFFCFRNFLKFIARCQIKILVVIRLKFSFLFEIHSFYILQSLSFQKINRIITAIDSQPMFDGGVIINVLGRLQVIIKINNNQITLLKIHDYREILSQKLALYFLIFL